MKKYFFILAVFMLYSCELLDSSIDFGNQYRLVEEYPPAIIYHKTPVYKGIGEIIIPPVVVFYGYNDRYIITKNIEIYPHSGNVKRGRYQYWIIDKKEKGASVEPFDSTGFYKHLDSLNVNLELKRRAITDYYYYNNNVFLEIEAS